MLEVMKTNEPSHVVFNGAVGALTGEQVEQEKERRLAATRESDVAGSHRPAEFIAQ